MFALLLLPFFWHCILSDQDCYGPKELEDLSYDFDEHILEEFRNERPFKSPLHGIPNYSEPTNSTLTCDPQYKYRSYDGSCNNLNNPTWGMSMTKFSRVLPANYRDGKYLPRISVKGDPLPLPRKLSMLLFPHIHNEDNRLSLLGMSWPQFVGHDIVSSKEDQLYDCCVEPIIKNESICIPIMVPNNDPFYSEFNVTCLNLNRNPHARGNSDSPRDQINFLTHMFDGSQVYGSNEKLAMSLRRFKKGQLLMSRSQSGGKFLPIKNGTSYLAGEPRVGQNPVLAILHTVMVREHNRIAKKLRKMHKKWNDEKLYQEARAIVVAELQHITYNEWAPLILGSTFTVKKGLFSLSNKNNYKYNDSLAPIAMNSFTASAFRIGHSAIQSKFKMYSNYEECPMNKLTLSNWFYKPRIIEKKQNFDALLRGVTKQPLQVLENYYTDQITQKLFRSNKPYGGDLLSRDISRGRDHGLQPYIKFVEHCHGYTIQNFSDLETLIPAKFVSKLKKIYDDVNDVDLHIGGVLEKAVTDANLGPTFQCLIGEQFYRLKYGDRFWYEVRGQPHSFTAEQLQEIKKITLARLICDNSNIKKIPPNSLLQPSITNPPKDCHSIPSINLDLF